MSGIATKTTSNMATAQPMNQRVVALSLSLIQRITGHQGEGRDVTDPRELYAILTLADAKREQASLAAPLNQDNSPRPSSDDDMNTRIVDLSPGRQRRRKRLSPLRPDYHRSMEMLESYRGSMPVVGLLRQASSLDDLTKRKDGTNRGINKENKRNHMADPLFFPDIQDKHKVTFENHTPRRKHKQSHNGRMNGVDKQEQLNLHSQNGYVEWLSATSRGSNGFQLQKSILERLRLRDQKYERSRPMFPKLEPNKPDLKAYDKYPNQYWELRSESVHHPQDLECDMIDREQYRLKQKSALKLKVVEHDKCDRRHRDMSPTFQMEDAINSSPTKRAKQKPRPQSVALSLSEPSDGSPFSDLIIGPTTENNACMPWMVNQELAPPNSRKAKKHTPYFLTEDVITEPRADNIRPRYHSAKTEKGTTVVNISIQHDTPKKRNPKHIEESLVKQQEVRHGNHAKETAGERSCLPLENGQRPKDDQRAGKEHNLSHVGRGKRHNDQKQKALLYGFKKIEVFGEYKQKPGDGELVLKLTDEPKKYIPRCHPPIYKLDMRNYPPQSNVNIIEDKNDRDANTAGDDKSDPNKRSYSRSVRIVDGTIILKRDGEAGNAQNVTGTVDKESKDTNEDALR